MKKSQFMMNVYKHIAFFLLLMILIVSCNTKTEECESKEKFDKDYCGTILSNALSKYMDVKWDSISCCTYSFENSIDTFLRIYGHGTSKAYGNAKFRVDSSWKLSETQQIPILQYLAVHHNDLGQIITICDTEDSLVNSIMDSTKFKIKLKEHLIGKREIYKERANAIRLAYQNKTKVHFGISQDKYNQLGGGFQKNFIDGLIGNGAYERARPVFVKGKLVGLEICSKNGSCCSHANIIDNAEVVKTHQSDVNRFYATETDYVSSLYNLRIYALSNGASGEYDETIAVWWNSYLRLYK